MSITVGTEIPPWTMPAVDAQRMKTMAAILRDPYPVHWDRRANEAIGLGGRTINQGPLNLGYVANMLMEWQGADCIRRLTVRFTRRVLDGEQAIARGRVVELNEQDGQTLATCEISLWVDEVQALEGTAVVTISGTR